jgi:leader peptidase (prepilin peptidase)/N-methyltransferase
MDIFVGFFVVALGLVIGSFLNVVILRFNTGKHLSGRSACFSCGRQLRWWDLIPLFSYFFSGGSCRYCGSRISLQYPLVEFANGLLFLGLLWKFGISFGAAVALLFFGLVMALLMIIFVYDIRHHIIPNVFVYLLIFMSFLSLFIEFPDLQFSLPSLADAVAGPLFAGCFFLLWFVSRGSWIGLGDSKLALAIGWLLGFSGGLIALMVAFWAGAIVGVGLILFSHALARIPLRGSHARFTMKSELPFAPFLIAGLVAVFFGAGNFFSFFTF